MAARRIGRGPLSSIELLPDEAEAIVAWAMAELKERKRLQQDIHAEFNERLAAIDLGPISMSAFNRHSFRLAAIARRHEETRAITSALVERLEPGQSDDLTVIAAETIKTLVFELLSNGTEITPKGAMELSNALRAAVAAQKVPIERKRAELAAFEVKVDEVLEKVQAERGLSAEAMATMRADFLGIRPQAAT